MLASVMTLVLLVGDIYFKHSNLITCLTMSSEWPGFRPSSTAFQCGQHDLIRTQSDMTRSGDNKS